MWSVLIVAPTSTRPAAEGNPVWRWASLLLHRRDASGVDLKEARASEVRLAALSPLAIAWLVGFNLRSVYLAVPPALPAIRQELSLSLAMAGLVAALPAICCCLGAIPGAKLANRYGVRIVIGLALGSLALAASARALSPQPFWLLLGTVGLATSIAITQPAMTAVVRIWFPGSIERANSLYLNGMCMGSLLGASLTPYLLLVMGWRATFLFWALPAVAATLLWFHIAPIGATLDIQSGRLLAGLRDREVWRTAVLFGTQNLVYTSAATWIPFVLGGSEVTVVALALLLLNLIQLAPTLIFAVLRWPYATSRALYLAAGLATVLGSGALAVGTRSWVVTGAVLIGAGTGVVGIAAFALPAVRAKSAAEVAGYSALMLTGGYALSFTGPLLGGFIADHTGSYASAVWPTIPAALLMLLLGATIPHASARLRLSHDGPRKDP